MERIKPVPFPIVSCSKKLKKRRLLNKCSIYLQKTTYQQRGVSISLNGLYVKV